MASPKITLELAHAPLAAAEDVGESPGVALARMLRIIAERVEQDVHVIPYAHGEWIPEAHTYRNENGEQLGTLTLELC